MSTVWSMEYVDVPIATVVAVDVVLVARTAGAVVSVDGGDPSFKPVDRAVPAVDGRPVDLPRAPFDDDDDVTAGMKLDLYFEYQLR